MGAGIEEEVGGEQGEGAGTTKIFKFKGIKFTKLTPKLLPLPFFLWQANLSLRIVY